MALFGKKKKDDISPESLGFGFPASEKKKETEFIGMDSPEETIEEPAGPMPPVPERQYNPPVQQTMPQRAPIEPIMPQRAQVIEPPIMPRAQPMQAPMEPALETRPVMPTTLPEDIQAPREPVIQRLRPHVFLKISKYKEVMTSIDKLTNEIRDLKKSLRSMKEVEDKEALKMKENEEILIRIEQIASVFDKIFSSPEK